jgi:hypothetical protein
LADSADSYDGGGNFNEIDMVFCLATAGVLRHIGICACQQSC